MLLVLALLLGAWTAVADAQTIAGTVTDAGTGAPLAGVSVVVYAGGGSYVTETSTNVQGSYTTPVVVPGTYYLRTVNSVGYIDELYNNIPCPGGSCPAVTTGTAVSAVGGSTTPDVDIALTLGGTISGVITNAATGLPVANVTVNVYRANGAGTGSGVVTDASGAYFKTSLPTGMYYVRTSNAQGYVDELYNNAPCVGGSCPSVTTGTGVNVTAGNATTGVDFGLAVGASITGVVTSAAGGLPLANVTVQVLNTSGSVVGSSVITNASGVFLKGGLTPGTHYVRTLNALGYLDELYANVVCPGGTCPTVTSGTGVSVTTGGTASGIDFELAMGGAIAGTVTNAATSAAIGNVTVSFYNNSGVSLGSTATDSTGAFRKSGLASGTYFLRTTNNLGFIDELYSDIACPNGTCPPVTTGTSVLVTVSSTTDGIIIALAPGATMTGTVTDAGSGAVLANVGIAIYDSTGTSVGSATTNPSGSYTKSGLAPGTYYARSSNALGYLDELYDSKPCLNGSCPVTSGTAIVLPSGVVTDNIDFGLTAGGSIAGAVTDAVTAAPIANVPVTAHDASGASLRTGMSDASGQYAVTGLAAGTYYLRTVTLGVYLNEIYADIPCPSCGVATSASISVPSGAASVAVTTGATTPGINFGLSPGGAIAGIVTDAATGLPLAGVSVSAAGSADGGATTDAAGAYTITGLPTGIYRLWTRIIAGYLNETYNDIQCADFYCSEALATGAGVAVTAGTTTGGIHFSLSRGGTIGGTVTNAVTGLPVSGVSIRFYTAAGETSGLGATTNAAGVYSGRTGLPTGTYRVRTSNAAGYLDEQYNDVPCPNESCAIGSGIGVAVIAGGTTGGIDFSLDVGGAISGTVTDAALGGVIPGVSVSIYSAVGIGFGNATTNASGVYTKTGLPAGTYFARATSSAGYVGESWNNIPGPLVAATAGTPITVTPPAATTGIDFQLDRAGGISGTITAAGSGAPLSGVTVRAMLGDGTTRAGYAATDINGFYGITSLPPGSYFLTTSNRLGYRDEVYDDIGCSLCQVTAGQAVTVTGPATTEGINFSLTALPPAPNDSCADAIQITSTPYLQQVSTAVATGAPEDPMPTCGYLSSSLAKNVWYRFVAPSDGMLTLHGVGSTYDTVISVYTGSCGSFTELPGGCFDDISASPSSGVADVGVLRVPVSADVTYTIQVGAFDGSGGPLVFSADFAPAGYFAGRVTAADGTTPVAGATVEVYDAGGVQMRTATTDTAGAYSAGPLPAGTYFAKTTNTSGFVERVYNQRACAPTASPGTCNPILGTPIAVGVGTTTGNVDFLLPVGGRASGTVQAANGSPLSVSVRLFDASGNLIASANSASDTGRYITPAVEPGGYYAAVASGSPGYEDQAYQNTTNCLEQPGCAVAPTPIVLSAGATTAGIDFQLNRGGEIGGVVTDAATNLPLRNVVVYITDASGAVRGSGASGADGNFRTTGLKAGIYYAYTDNAAGYLNQVYGGTSCTLGCDATAGAPIVVAAGAATTGIRFGLVRGGRISGTVIEQGTATPLPGIAVHVLDGGGAVVGTAVTDGSGQYVSNQGLPGGTYSVRTDPSAGHAMQIYNSGSCPSGNCALPGDAVTVVQGGTASGIDFSMPACPVALALAPAALPHAPVNQPYSEFVAGASGTATYRFYPVGAPLYTASYLTFGGTLPPDAATAADAIARSGRTWPNNGYYPVRTVFTSTFRLAGGLLPPGLTLNSITGQLAGTPTRAGQYAFTLGTVDAAGCGAARVYRLSVGEVPIVTWPTPASMIVGTPLSATQLNAQASVPGTFVYSPPAETVLPVGAHTLSVTFMPADQPNYVPVMAFVQIHVGGSGGGDFTGDLKSDLLWRHGTQGDVWLWAMDGGVSTSETYMRTVAEPGWEIRGLGDQTGDGTADILWRHAPTGMVYLWTMNGSTVEAETYVGTVEPAFDIVGTGDYDGDGKSDILWRHLANGQLWLWLMDGPATLEVSYVDTVDSTYAVQGSGDLNADGKADIVWQNTAAGDVWVWLMSGATPQQVAYVYTVGELEYRIVGVADHTGDGRADILWHHDTRGEVWLWPMIGPALVNQIYVDTIPDTGYRIVGNGDYNGDGKADIMWHHNTRGEVWVWLMNGATKLSETWAGSVPEAAYQIVKVK
jgi:hypothetical protein